MKTFNKIITWLVLVFVSVSSYSQDFEGTHPSGMKSPYLMPQYFLEVNRLLTIIFRTSPDVVQALVPKPLIVKPDAPIIFYVGEYEITKPDEISFFEAGIVIPASYKNEKQGFYFPVLYGNNVLPITISKQLWGYSNYFQTDKFVLKVEKEVVRANVVKNGTTLIDATLRLGNVLLPETSPLYYSMFILKSSSSAEGKGAFDVKQIISVNSRNSIFCKIRSGEVTGLRLHSTATEFQGTIPVLEIVNASYSQDGGALFDHYGEVIHDYLALEKPNQTLNDGKVNIK